MGKQELCVCTQRVGLVLHIRGWSWKVAAPAAAARCQQVKETWQPCAWAQSWQHAVAELGGFCIFSVADDRDTNSRMIPATFKWEIIHTL